ncbi:nitroreductase family protein [Alkalicoccus urumqiensis]|uniref:Nitroreductase n=1 Tax=Alkalicoccus urumqiensis TaxID=1548213 RepID=A0A2P6MLC9_ALKUR|nr:nitroreductase [Alkalicoccus urumqiensis]PRO67074.1 nitroreductase [Alkalicoccus urumqiensis]
MTTRTVQTPIAKVIRERRSIKTGYLEEDVPKELVMELLEDAVWAPNHGLREPWRFVFVSGEEKDAFAEEMASTFPLDMRENRRNYFSDPKAFLIVLMKEDPRQKQWEENFGAVSCLIHNFQLLAWEKRLGVVWKTNPHIYDPKVREKIGAAPDEKIAGFLHLGFFDPAEPPKRRQPTPVSELVTDYQSK